MFFFLLNHASQYGIASQYELISCQIKICLTFNIYEIYEIQSVE